MVSHVLLVRYRQTRVRERLLHPVLKIRISSSFRDSFIACAQFKFTQVRVPRGRGPEYASFLKTCYPSRCMVVCSTTIHWRVASVPSLDAAFMLTRP